MGSTSAPKIGEEVVCRYDGRNRRARVTRVVDSNVVDVSIIDDAGNIVCGLREVSRANEVDQQVMDRRWWPTPYGLDSGLVGGVGGKGGRARVGGVGIAIGGPGGKGGPLGPGGDGGDAEVDGDGVALGGEGGEAGQRDRGGRGGRNPLEAHGFPDIQLPDGSWFSEYGRGGNGGFTGPEPSDEPDRAFARMAIEQARKCTAEDERDRPKVGAVVVRDGRLLASAYRGELGPGEHSEFTLLEKKLGDAALVGATVYVTLEPCTTRNHPKISCAERLLERRVARVVIGMVDPDPRITGQGIMKLRAGRIEVAFFAEDLAAEVEELNRHWVRSIRATSIATGKIAEAPAARASLPGDKAKTTAGADGSTSAVPDGAGATSLAHKLPRLEVVYGAMLGQGAFGSVWEATDVLDRKVAIKVLTSTDEAFDEEALLRNARTLAQLSHPNLVTVYGAGLLRHPEKGLLTPGLLMEFLPGEPLSKWANVKHEREHALRVASDVFQGLQAIHAGGLHHGDLHAMNVMVLPDSRAKVIDWRHQDTFLAKSAGSRADVIAADRRAAIDVICSMFEKQGLNAEARKLERAPSVADALAIVEQLRSSDAPRPRRWRLIIAAVTLLVFGLVIFSVKSLLTKRALPFATVIPQTHSQNLELTIWNEGDEPLTGVAAKIICYSCSPIASEPEINIGTIPARGFREMKPSFSPQLGADGIATYMILISDLNGQVVEGLQFRPGHNSLPWAFSYQVSRQTPRDNGDGTTTTHPEVLKQATWSDDFEDGKPPK